MIQFLGLVSIGLMTVTLALTSDYQLDHPSEPARDPSLDLTLDYIQARIDLDNAAWRARHR